MYSYRLAFNTRKVRRPIVLKGRTNEPADRHNKWTHYRASNGRITVSAELSKMWYASPAAYFKILSHHLSGTEIALSTVSNMETPHQYGAGVLYNNQLMRLVGWLSGRLVGWASLCKSNHFTGQQALFACTTKYILDTNKHCRAPLEKLPPLG